MQTQASEHVAADRLRLGIAGLGTVAQGLLQLLGDNSEQIIRSTGRRITVSRVASRSAKPEVDIGDARFSTDLESLQSSDVDVVVELIGGTDTAAELVRTSLEKGRAVVTANKALLASHGNELFATASERKTPLGFEASVCGGIPIVSVLGTGLSGNQVTTIAGIINGTCNYILTAMDERGVDFSTALSEAQDLGFAEADPTFDVEGIDAAQKLAILAALAFRTSIDADSVYVEGISGVRVEDLEYAADFGYKIKHIGIAKRTKTGIEVRVHPVFVNHTSLIASVANEMNAVQIGSNAVDTLALIGPGAGGRPTASAVLADIIEVARGNVLPHIGNGASLPAVPIDDIESRYYLNIPASDQPGTFAHLASVMSKHGISMDEVRQKSDAVRETNGQPWVPVALLTDRIRESTVNTAIDELSTAEYVRGPIRRIRVIDLNS